MAKLYNLLKYNLLKHLPILPDMTPRDHPFRNLKAPAPHHSQPLSMSFHYCLCSKKYPEHKPIYGSSSLCITVYFASFFKTVWSTYAVV